MQPRRFLYAHRTIMPSAIVLALCVSAQAAFPALSFNIPCDSIGPVGTPFVRGVNCRGVIVDGWPRQFLVYIPHAPSFRMNKPAPVVFHYHGTGGSAESALIQTGWWEKAEEAGFIVVLGSAVPHLEASSGQFKPKWSSLSIAFEADLSVKPPGYPPGALWPVDDVAFTDAMAAEVLVHFGADPRRLYLSGFSSGAAMAMRLAIERSQVFAAAGVAAGSLLRVYDPPHKLPIYLAIGTRDDNLLDQINWAPDHPTPPLQEIPLNYAEAFGFAGMRFRVHTILETFGVPLVPDHVWEFENEMRLRYRTPLTGNKLRNEAVVSIQADVIHQFPSGDDNPEGFDDRDRFWKFFQDHPFPK